MTTLDPSAPGPRRHGVLALLALCLAAAAAISIALGQDGNWDLQNYHYYGPWALVRGRGLGHDLAAAQLQTFFNPLLDLPFYLMVDAQWNPRAIAAVLALPAGWSAWLLLRLAWLLFGDATGGARVVATLASAAIGLTAAMAVGTLGTTMNDWPGAALILASLWILAPAIVARPDAPLPTVTLVAAGLVAGAASGLKLTVATFALALCIGLVARPPLRPRERLRDGFAFGLAVLAGLALTYGYWGWQLWSHFGNPLFPYANTWFRSPWWDPTPVMARVYGPHTLRAWLRFPLDLFAPAPGFVTEVPYADARIPTTYVLALVAAASLALRRLLRLPDDAPPLPSGVRAARVVVGVFWAASFVLWTAQHSIVRYIIVLEITSGLLIVGMLRWMLRPAHAGAAVTVVAALLIATTQWPDWWRVEYGRRWFETRVPPVEPRALVLLVNDAPMAYVLPQLPEDARFLGVRNNINDPGRRNELERRIATAIAMHTGPMYSLSHPAGKGDADLAAHGLRRAAGGCADVVTNLRASPIELCRLERIAPGG